MLTACPGCFRCSECQLQLTLRNYNSVGQGQQAKELYCDQHVPKAKHTEVFGTFRTSHAAKMQQQNTDGKVAKVHKDGEAPPADE